MKKRTKIKASDIDKLNLEQEINQRSSSPGTLQAASEESTQQVAKKEESVSDEPSEQETIESNKNSEAPKPSNTKPKRKSLKRFDGHLQKCQYERTDSESTRISGRNLKRLKRLADTEKGVFLRDILDNVIDGFFERYEEEIKERLLAE